MEQIRNVTTTCQMWGIVKNIKVGKINARDIKNSSRLLGVPQAPTEENKIMQNVHNIGQARHVSSSGNLPNRSSLLLILTTSHSACERNPNKLEIT